MKNNSNALLRACVLAGFLPAIIAPILWALFLIFLTGELNFLSYQLISIVFFGLIMGMLATMILGFPVLLILEIYNLNDKYLAAIIGAALACMILLVFGPEPGQAPIEKSWPLFVFFGLLGGSVGALASFYPLILRNNKSNKGQAGLGIPVVNTMFVHSDHLV